jgi:hypothetical protein
MTKCSLVYPPEFQQHALELIASRKSANAIEFKIFRQTRTNWIRQDAIDGGRRNGLTITELTFPPVDRCEEIIHLIRRPVVGVELWEVIGSERYVSILTRVIDF